MRFKFFKSIIKNVKLLQDINSHLCVIKIHEFVTNSGINLCNRLAVFFPFLDHIVLFTLSTTFYLRKQAENFPS